MKRVIAPMTLATLMNACTPTPPSAVALPAPALAGADRDAHGCIASAGYIWSPLRGECIRIFEAGLSFERYPTPTQEAALAAFVVLVPAQGDTVTAAEVFVPGRSGPLALTLVHAPEGDIRPTLLENKAEGVRLFRHKGEHVLEVNGQTYRRVSPPDDRLFKVR